MFKIRRSAAIATVAVLGIWTFSGAASGASFSVPVVTVLQMHGRQIQTDHDYYSLPTGTSAS